MKIKFGSFEFEIDNLFELVPFAGLVLLGIVALAEILGGK